MLSDAVSRRLRAVLAEVLAHSCTSQPAAQRRFGYAGAGELMAWTADKPRTADYLRSAAASTAPEAKEKKEKVRASETGTFTQYLDLDLRSSKSKIQRSDHHSPTFWRTVLNFMTFGLWITRL